MAKKKDDSYKQDGVDIDAGDEFSKFAGSLARSTYGNSPFVKVYDLSRGNFRGPRGFKYMNLPEGFIETGTMDGIGTKVVLIDAANAHETAGSNLIAMTAMDITRYGGYPAVFMNILDVSSLGEMSSSCFSACKRLVVGLRNECHEHGYVMLTGETAELGPCVGSENPEAIVKFNWGGAMLGVYHPNKMILGDTLAPGQVVMALRDDFRSNGISSVRKALAKKYGESWWANENSLASVQACASSSVQYDRFLNYLHGWYNGPTFEPEIKLHLIVHLSGGAFESKLGKDMLQPLGLSAELDRLFDPSLIMKECAQWRGMSDRECYRAWNGGQGAIVVIDRDSVIKFRKAARNYGIETKIAGRITEKADYNVAIRSMFGSDEIIHY